MPIVIVLIILAIIIVLVVRKYRKGGGGGDDDILRRKPTPPDFTPIAFGETLMNTKVSKTESDRVPLLSQLKQVNLLARIKKDSYYFNHSTLL